jgi:hypothetical protein
VTGLLELSQSLVQSFCEAEPRPTSKLLSENCNSVPFSQTHFFRRDMLWEYGFNMQLLTVVCQGG